MTRRPGRDKRNNIKWDVEGREPLLVEPDDVSPYNPLDTRNLGTSVVKALLEKKAYPLRQLNRFQGAGIYVIYYHGKFAPYAPLARANQDRSDPRWPIYIGKAIPAGGRRGADLTATDTSALSDRLREHAESVEAANNLSASDFSCRFLVVQDIWIPLAEQLLISHFAPVWNRTIDGFGNHDPGSGRYNGLRPRWDVLHPGRAWAERCRPRSETDSDIAREAAEYLRGAALPSVATLGGNFGGK